MSSRVAVVENLGVERTRRVHPSAILHALETILASDAFKKAQRSKRFLQFIVGRCLANDLDALKENVIALEVFEKSSAFNAKVNSRVRTGANRLRRLLSLYYSGQGRNDDILISLPVGSYLPVFAWNEPTSPSLSPVENLSGIPNKAFVGRREQFAELNELACETIQGRSSLVCIVAELGVGKTAFLDAFLEEYGHLRVGKGQCRLQFQNSQPYQVWLDVLAELGRSDASAIELLRAHAPHWFDLLEGSAFSPQGANSNVLRREMEHFFQKYTLESPAILVFDDLHWADSATIELLGHLIPAIASFRLLILTAYRPSDMKLRQGQFLSWQRELSIHQLCQVISLPSLNHRELREYLNIRFPGHQIGGNVIDALYQASSGNALCATNMVDYAIKRKWIGKDRGVWTFSPAPRAWRSELPPSVSEMAAKKLEELDEDTQDLLWKCSIQGSVFDSGIIAEVLKVSRRGLERRLRRLCEIHHLLRPLTDRAVPKAGSRYEFFHFLYFDALDRQERLPERRKLSALIAEAMLNAYGEADHYAAPTMARLFEHAGTASRARQFYLCIAMRAAGMSAFREVFNVTEHALSLVLERPPDETDLRCEMDLLTLQGRAGAALFGFEFSAIENICRKAGKIAARLQDSQASMRIDLVHWGMVANDNFVRGLSLARAVSRNARLRANAEFTTNGGLATGVSLLHQGSFRPAAKTLAQTYEHWSANSQKHLMPGVSVSVGIAILCNWARSLWFLGSPDQALAKALQASEVADGTGFRKDAAYASALIADIYHLRGDVEATVRWAHQCIEIAQPDEFGNELSWSRIFKTSVLTEKAGPDRGQEIGEVLNRYQGPCRAKFLCHYAWASGVAGDCAKGMEILDEASGSARARHETYYDAELIRTRGELILLQKNLAPSALVAVPGIFKRAAAKARSQHSLALELRAITSVLRFDLLYLPRAVGQDAADLRRVLDSFHEGAETADVRLARKTLLQAESIG